MWRRHRSDTPADLAVRRQRRRPEGAQSRSQPGPRREGTCGRQMTGPAGLLCRVGRRRNASELKIASAFFFDRRSPSRPRFRKRTPEDRGPKTARFDTGSSRERRASRATAGGSRVAEIGSVRPIHADSPIARFRPWSGRCPPVTTPSRRRSPRYRAKSRSETS